MGKVYKGYELIKAIVDGEIKECSKFNITGYKQKIIYTKGLLCYINNYWDEVSSSVIINCTFELIEDEIDIQSIEELNDTCYDAITMSDEDIEYYHNFTAKKLNEIIRAVKQIDKKIKEKE